MANQNPNTSGLTPWKPGQSGNPGGRPRRVRLDDLLREIMARETVDQDGNPTGETVGEQFLWRILNHAMTTGNQALVREILDRHDGKPAEDQHEEVVVRRVARRIDPRAPARDDADADG